jgi:hypothetical protein
MNRWKSALLPFPRVHGLAHSATRISPSQRAWAYRHGDTQAWRAPPPKVWKRLLRRSAEWLKEYSRLPGNII